jgi:pimeloyl-ACP methyl ester carboxylesterase
MSISHVRSGDGTRIAYEQSGAGSPVVLVGGAFNDASTVRPLAEVLSGQFTAVAYDRRGRGQSTDNRPYGADRVAAEVADLVAVIEQVGAPSYVFGHSSGAVLALEAAMAEAPISRLAVYEPSYVVDGARPRPGEHLIERIEQLLQAGDRDAAAALFLEESAGVPAPVVAQMKHAPIWGWFASLAHSLPYDLAVSGRGNLMPVDRLRAIAIPTLVLNGGATESWLEASAKTLATVIPQARHTVIDGEDHSILQHPDALRDPLTEFFTDPDQTPNRTPGPATDPGRPGTRARTHQAGA